MAKVTLNKDLAKMVATLKAVKLLQKQPIDHTTRKGVRWVGTKFVIIDNKSKLAVAVETVMIPNREYTSVRKGWVKSQVPGASTPKRDIKPAHRKLGARELTTQAYIVQYVKYVEHLLTLKDDKGKAVYTPAKLNKALKQRLDELKGGNE